MNINAEDYADLKGQVWFLTTSGQVEHASRFPNMHVVEPSELYNFAVENQNTHLLPPSIQAWFRLLREQNVCLSREDEASQTVTVARVLYE